MNWIIITKYNMYFSIQEKEVEQRAQPLYISILDLSKLIK